MPKSIFLSIGFICCSIIAFAHPGIGIVMDSGGNVFYTDLVHVWKISPEGVRTLAVKDVHTHELYLDEDDNLYGEHEWYEGEQTDKWGNYVWCLSKDGVLEKVIPDVEGFLDDNTLVRDNDGNSYWIRHSEKYEQIIKRDALNNDLEFTFHEFDDIRWMYYSKDDGHLYVVDNLSIKKVDRTGNVSIVANNLKEDHPVFQNVADRHYVFGIWTDSQSNVYVALYGAKKIKKISSSGDIATVYESPKGWSPCGGLIDRNGTLWVMEFSKNNETRVKVVNGG